MGLIWPNGFPLFFSASRRGSSGTHIIKQRPYTNHRWDRGHMTPTRFRQVMKLLGAGEKVIPLCRKEKKLRRRARAAA